MCQMLGMTFSCFGSTEYTVSVSTTTFLRPTAECLLTTQTGVGTVQKETLEDFRYKTLGSVICINCYAGVPGNHSQLL